MGAADDKNMRLMLESHAHFPRLVLSLFPPLE